MRLPDSKIKEAILHPDRLVRHEALWHFSKSFSRDPDVMPLAIKAIKTYGRQEAFYFGNLLEDLVQTETTLGWAIEELNKFPPRSDAHFLHCRLIASVDPQVLLLRKEEILEHPAFHEDYRDTVRERLKLVAWDDDDCWRELENLCEGEDTGLENARPAIQALARHTSQADRVLSMLSEEIGDDNDPKLWMEIILVMLAGEMRLETACPQIVAKLHRVEELLAEECAKALTKIGTAKAAIALSEGFLKQSWDYRLFASAALENLHTDATVEKCLELLPLEKKADIKTNLANAVIGSFAFEGVEPVVEMVRKRQYDPQMSDLAGRVAAAAIIMDVDFPERDLWKQQAEERYVKIAKRIMDLENWASTPPPRSNRQEEKPEPIRRPEESVGRNNPCPCGSGKKFKKCCMNKKSSFLL